MKFTLYLNKKWKELVKWLHTLPGVVTSIVIFTMFLQSDYQNNDKLMTIIDLCILAVCFFYISIFNKELKKGDK